MSVAPPHDRRTAAPPPVERRIVELPSVVRNEPLAALTTLAVGGLAAELISVDDEESLRDALADAARRELPTFVLGGGSNVLAADAGFDGRVLRYDARGLEIERLDGESGESGESGERTALVRADAGLDWDAFVAAMVAEGLAGLECLSGIPGRVGAAPIQNVGAYGQEVAETIERVRVVDRASGESLEIRAADCGFGYRTSRFKTDWRDRYVVTRVDFRLPIRDVGTVRYGDLRRLLGSGPSLVEVRDAVLDVRRSKSMVLAPHADPNDPNRRSAGSFFVNPIVDRATADEAARRAVALGSTRELPRFPVPSTNDRVKLSAAWLIEEAGFPRGYTLGRAGLSTKHTLALINRGDARAADLVALARRLRIGVRDAFGVTLEPEPVFLGFDRPVHELLESP